MAMRQAALVSDESALEACACSRRCAIQIDDLYLLPLPLPLPASHLPRIAMLVQKLRVPRDELQLDIRRPAAYSDILYGL